MSMTGEQQSELRTLVSGLCEGTLNSDTFASLTDWLERDDEAVAAYVSYLDLHTSLAWEISADNTTAPSEKPVQSEWRERLADAWVSYKQPWPLALTVATLFIAVMVLGLALIVPETRERLIGGSEPVAPVVVARVTALHEVEWKDAAQSLSMDSKLPTGTQLELAAGVVEVTYIEGTRLTFEGPGTLIVDGFGSGRLEQGRLVGFVPRRAIGFTIETPVARVVDLGTEFGVEVDGSGETDVVVYRGEVSVGNRLPTDSVVTLTAGQSHRVTTDGTFAALPDPPNLTRTIRSEGRLSDPVPVTSYRYLGPESDPRIAVHVTNKGYYDDDRRLLSDSVLGSNTHNDDRWVGWFDRESLPSGDSGLAQPAILFELSNEANLHAIQVCYLVHRKMEIRAPDRVVVAVSADGEQFEQVVEFHEFDDDNARRGTMRVAEIPLNDITTRFVRLEFFNDGQWTFLSEVLIMPVVTKPLRAQAEEPTDLPPAENSDQ